MKNVTSVNKKATLQKKRRIHLKVVFFKLARWLFKSDTI